MRNRIQTARNRADIHISGEAPSSLGLPPNVKQKVVWLCGKCAQSYKVVFDEQRCQVLVVNHERVHKRSA